MTTGTAATTARQYAQQMIHYLRKSVTFADNGVAKTVGIIPSGSLILKPSSGIHVTTTFDAGSTNTLNIGTTANDDLYGTLLTLDSTSFVPLDEAVSYLVAADTTITATVVLTGTAATAGAGEVIIAYIPDNDG